VASQSNAISLQDLPERSRIDYPNYTVIIEGRLLNYYSQGFSNDTVYDENGTFLGSYVYSGDQIEKVMLPGTSGAKIVTTFDLKSGLPSSESDRYADGSIRDKTFLIVDQPYVEQDTTYDFNHRETSVTRFYGDARHTIQMKQTFASDSSSKTYSYDTSGRETTRILTAADGSKEVVNSTYAGAATTPSSVADYRYSAANQLLSIDTTNPDGSHTEVAKTAGVTLTSTHGVADSFTSAGADTFVFAPASGQDLITSFHAGSGAGHDTVDLSAYGFSVPAGESSLDVLASALKQVGQNVVLALTPTDSVAFKNTAVASLTASNFKLA
jgi:hypothetical protein